MEGRGGLRARRIKRVREEEQGGMEREVEGKSGSSYRHL